MKFFTLVNNKFLSDKQCGIQSTHACSGLYKKYNDNLFSPEFRIFHEWATKHERMVMLRGTDCLVLQQSYERIKHYAEILKLPHVIYNEDGTLNFAITSIGFILPESDYFSDDLLPTWLEFREYLDGFYTV